MFIYKGGQAVQRGTYWDSENNSRVVLHDDGDSLPGVKGDVYFKLPESYLLIPVLLLGLALSTAFPYGIGFLSFVGIIVMGGALYAAGSSSYRLMKEMFGKTATFSYAPGTSYLAGKKTQKTGKEASPEK